MTAAAVKRPAYELHPRQMDAMQLVIDHLVDQLLYGGAAGGGKSELLRAAAYHFAMTWPGARIPIFRQTWPELEETHIIPWFGRMEELGFPIKECWHATPKNWVFPNGSIVEFRHIDQTLGARKWLSAEWAALLVDEAGLFSPDDLRLLYSRVRRPQGTSADDWPGWHPVAIYATNPGGPAHAYLKETYIDESATHPEGYWDVEVEIDGRRYSRRRAFLRSMLVDNPSINPDEYVFQLADLPEEERKRMLEGDWNYFEGKVFANLREDIHLVDARDAFGGEVVPPVDWARIAGMDHGTANPTAFEWTCQEDDGFFVTYLEYYSPGPVSQHIEAVKSLMMLDGRNDLIPEADPRMWHRTQGLKRMYSVAEEYAWNGQPPDRGEMQTRAGIPLHKSTVERMASRLALQRLLEPDPNRPFPSWHPRAGEYGAPRWFIAKQCPNLWRELNNIRYQDGSEDTVKVDDHAYDAASRSVPLLEQRLYARRGSGPRRIIEAGRR